MMMMMMSSVEGLLEVGVHVAHEGGVLALLHGGLVEQRGARAVAGKGLRALAVDVVGDAKLLGELEGLRRGVGWVPGQGSIE